MGQQYESITKEYCRRASEYLEGAFSFTYNPEGYEFWASINQRLKALATGKTFDTPIPMASVEAIKAENVRLINRVAKLQEEINSQAQTIVDLRKKLLIADFCNMGR